MSTEDSATYQFVAMYSEVLLEGCSISEFFTTVLNMALECLHWGSLSRPSSAWSVRVGIPDALIDREMGPGFGVFRRVSMLLASRVNLEAQLAAMANSTSTID